MLSLISGVSSSPKVMQDFLRDTFDTIHSFSYMICQYFLHLCVSVSVKGHRTRKFKHTKKSKCQAQRKPFIICTFIIHGKKHMHFIKEGRICKDAKDVNANIVHYYNK